jgi:hypothetical protein
MTTPSLSPRWSLGVVVASLFVTSAAGATENFPPAIANHLQLSYEPSCALCHVGAKTGGGTVTTPFGRSARDRGLVEENTEILNAVLDQMRTERVDSDSDGVTDVEELVASTDPNARPNDPIREQEYGCVGRIAGGDRSTPSVAALLVLVAAGVCARRRGGRGNRE